MAGQGEKRLSLRTLLLLPWAWSRRRRRKRAAALAAANEEAQLARLDAVAGITVQTSMAVAAGSAAIAVVLNSAPATRVVLLIGSAVVGLTGVFAGISLRHEKADQKRGQVRTTLMLVMLGTYATIILSIAAYTLFDEDNRKADETGKQSTSRCRGDTTNALPSRVRDQGEEDAGQRERCE